MDRVAITGLGMMNSLGLDLESSWSGLVQGFNPVGRFTLFEPEGLPCPFGMELSPAIKDIFRKQIIKRQRRQMTRGTMIAIATAKMTLDNSGIIEYSDLNPERIGVVIGCTGTGYAPTTLEKDDFRILRNMASSPAAWASLKNKLLGPSFVVSTACSSGAYALSAAYSMILSGQCDAVLAGAADSALNYPDVEGFCSLTALSEDVEHMKTASRPFNKSRNGFVLGEGGGMLLLESFEHAQKRQAKIIAQMALPGLCSEGYNIISPKPGGKSMAKAMNLALEHAQLDPSQIDYINAHGTSTLLNDYLETLAIKSVFKENAYSIPISSTKSMTGHCLSAAAGIEAVICCKALVENAIPPTINLNEPDPELDLDFVPNEARQKKLHHVMSNSFAFGGHNGVCIFSRCD